MSISKIAMLTFGMVILTSSAFLAQQAAGQAPPNVATQCDECPNQLAFCLGQAGSDQGAIDQCNADNAACIQEFCPLVAGSLTPIDTTMVLAAGVQSISAWMIPIIVSAAGIAIVIARKFSKYQPI